jgi:hypothetical protein
VNAAVGRRRVPVTGQWRNFCRESSSFHPQLSSKRPSEEKVALVGFPFSLSMSSEAHLFRVVGTEFIAEKLTARCAPGL